MDHHNWPLPIEAFQDQCKQTMTNIERNTARLRIPTDERQLVIYKRSREVKLWATENNIS